MLYQHITAYLSVIKLTRLITGNVCVQAEGMQNPVRSSVCIDPAPCGKNPIKRIKFLY